ncbi:MAG: Clp protease [Intrasporangium sp.]|uniref:Clp protease N-terminal domain-containing protein n=1 Tax=Intrasporangium sp. TaxID=1925024 RepID=UPI00264968D3|nr:Clp protease N-terminal domain-containing protein [Intrasporangium sp.]MDN5796060.1 Clp protease [Intrasporangium sp.]
MFERFAQSARIAVEDARFEASRRGDRRVGTEHLLLALLSDETLADMVGVDAMAARQAADELDRAALAEIGLEVGGFHPTGRAAVGKPVPLTPGAKAVIRETLTHAAAEKSRHLTSRHLLLALLDRGEPDPAAAIFDALSVDREQVRQRLAPAEA